MAHMYVTICVTYKPKMSIALSKSAMLFALIFPRAQRASAYGISAERNVWATVGSAIVCDRVRLYGNRSLCDRLRSAIVCDRLRSYGNQP